MPRTSHVLAWFKVHRVSLASWVVLTLSAASLTVYAINAHGQPVHHADLNDGGVWVSNQALGAVARENKPISQLDAYVAGSAGQAPDVLQDGSAVISVGSGGALTPVSTTKGVAVTDNAVATAGSPVLGGGSVATVDPATGKLWAMRVDPDVDIDSLAGLDQNSDPIARVGAKAMVTVTSDGTVLAASAEKDTLTTLAPRAEGFAKPVSSRLAAAPEGGIIAMTAVGDQAVVLDAQGELLVGGHRVKVAAPGAPVQLQQPGPDATDVLVATDGHLLGVPMTGGSATSLVAAQGTPAQPVRVGSCAFAAWASGTTGQIATVCDGQKPTAPASFALSADAELVFRVNRNQVLLNDVRNGDVWNIDSGKKPVQVADWQSVAPTKPQQQSQQNQMVTTSSVRQPPQAKPDTLGARPGRTTVLHVLDNDLVSGGGVLSIVGVTAPKDAGVTVQPAPDRESVLLTLAPSVTRGFSFRYTISDGSGGKDATADGNVTINVMTDAGSAAPVVRENAGPAVHYPVTEGRSLEVPVTDDWRDPKYGDPVTLDDVKPSAGVDATITPQGLVSVTPAKVAGTVKVPYVVSTGGTQTAGTLILDVLPVTSHKPVAPQANPDVAAGEVGGAIVVHPLDNDIPGADPTDPSAHLEMAGKVAPNGGLQVDTDLAAGTVTVHASRPGSYTLQYAAGYGAAKRSASDIRVDVDPASDAGDAPIATPDTTTIRGTSPMVVDVLANDYDPKGRLLAVQHAEPVDRSSPLRVAIIDGHWLRINATTVDMEPKTQAIAYTISDGVNTATGTVSVTQKSPLPTEQNHPIAVPDDAVVRSSDSVLVPVLENDSTPSGDPVGLRVPYVAGLTPGQVPVEEGVGKAYVSGNAVRYVAPQVTSATTVHVDYTVENTADPERPESAGVLTINIVPPPSVNNPNQPPTPREIDARMVEGDTTTLRLPPVGNDPDGDSVSIVGVASAPQHGRILSYGADSMVYQAFPGSTGTDEFGYLVSDKYGATAQGTVRVAVVPPGAPQAPVAVDDVVTADLGHQVQVDVLGNDLRTPGTTVRIEPLQGAPAGVKLESSTGPIEVTSSTNPKQAVVVTYRITNGIDESVGQLTVKSQAGYDNPPAVQNLYAQPRPDSTSTTVDVLAKAFDIDGPPQDLKVTSVGDSKAVVAGGKVTLPVLDSPQVVPFEVTDAQGATAAAAIFVPARPSGTPYVKPGASLSLNPGQTKDFALSDIVADPEGDHVVLTLEDKIIGEPSGELQAGTPKSKNDVLELTAGKQAGPAAVTFEVSDRADISDPKAHTVTLTMPVQVGSTASELTCPDEPLDVYVGAASNLIDVASVCHVWTPDPAEAAQLQYVASWQAGQQPRGVAVSNTAEGIQIKAAVDAVAGQTGTLEVAAKGGKASAQLHVQVLAAGPPSLKAMSLQTEAGKPVSVDVASFATSPFGAGAKWALVGAPQKLAGPMSPTVTVKGTTVTIATADDAKAFGSYRFKVAVSDNGNAAGSKRPIASAVISLAVVAPPSPPTNVHSDGRTYDGRVVLLWTPPAANGGTISSYTVSWSGGSHECASSPCSIDGLKNGQTYSFTVVAHNQYGDSKPSAPGTGKPDRVPDAVTNLQVSKQEDHSVTLTWSNPAKLDYSPIQHFYISYPNGGVASVGAGTFSYTATGLTNGQNVDFTVWAENAAGRSQQRVTMSGMGAGKPEVPTQLSASTANLAGNGKGVTISWAPVDPNGPDPVTYEVARTGGGAPKTVCAWQATTTCTDQLGYDGATYKYTVVARNLEATAAREPDPSRHISAASSPATVIAATTPDKVSNLKVTATGVNKQVHVSFDVGHANGAVNTISCRPDCPTTSVPTTGGHVEFNLDSYSNGDPANFEVQTCNAASGSASDSGGSWQSCSAWVSDNDAVPYGPIPADQLILQVPASGNTFHWSFSGESGGRAVKVTLKMDSAVIDTLTSTGTHGFSDSGSKTVGYNENHTFTLSVEDTVSGPDARNSQSISKQGKTEAPPPPSVGVTQDSGTTWVHAVVRNLVQSANSTVTIQCWATNDSSGAGGTHVGSFSMVLDAGGNGSLNPNSTCQMSSAQGTYGNLRIGPNIVWSNTITLN